MEIPKKDELKNSSLRLKDKQQEVKVVNRNFNINSALRKETPMISLSEQLIGVVNREFEKIKANLL